MRYLLAYPAYSTSEVSPASSLMVGQQVRFKRKGYNSNLLNDQQSSFIGTGVFIEIKGDKLTLRCPDGKTIIIALMKLLYR